MENNLKFIKTFPNKIKKINLKSLKENHKTKKLNGNNLITIYSGDLNLLNNLLFAKENNEVLIINSDFDEIDKLYTSKDDKVINFGYNFLTFNKKICVTGINDKGSPIIYIYNFNNKLELESKLILENIKGSHYMTYVNNKLLIIKFDYINDENYLIFYTFKLYDNKVEKDDIIKLQLVGKTAMFSADDNHLFVNNNKYLYIIDLKSYQVVRKEEKICSCIESFIFSNINLTIIAHQVVEIYDSNLNIRQTINLQNINMIKIYDSYLFLVDLKNNIIYIYALNQNGIFIDFAKISNIGNISNINNVKDKIILTVDDKVKYIDLPKRIFLKNDFIGYGFYISNNNIDYKTYGKPIFLENGRLTTHKTSDLEVSLIIGYTKNISELIAEDYQNVIDFSIDSKLISNEEFHLIDNHLLNDYILISEELEISNKILNKTNINFIFIEQLNAEIFLKANKGDSMKIKMNNYEKSILWNKDGIMKLELINNDSIIEIKTKSDIEILGYTKRKNSKKHKYKTYLISESNDILINSKLLYNYQTFFPYINNNKINGLVTNKIEDLDINFHLFPIKINLPDYNLKSTMKVNNLNQQFNRRYLIENNEKSIIVTDILLDKQIIEYKTNEVTDIKMIKYVNPLLIILSKPDNNIDTSLHLINTKNNKVIPYVISNTKKENLTNFFICNNQSESLGNSRINNNTLVFVTNNKITNIIYIINLDDSNELNNIKKITFNDDIKNLKLFNNYLAVETTKKEIILYDIKNGQTLISFSDENLVSFDIFYNHFVVLLYTSKLEIFVYKIEPSFDLLLTQELENKDPNSHILFGPGKIIIYNKEVINIFHFDDYNGITNVDNISEHFVHYYKNILLTKNTSNSEYYNVYRFSPQLNYIDMHVNCGVKLDKLILKNKKGIEKSTSNLFFSVNKNSKIKINGLKDIYFDKICKDKSIIKMVLELDNNEEFVIDSLDKNIKFCGIIYGELNDALPCFLPGTLINTPNGEIPIEILKKDDIIYNENNEETIIRQVHKWETCNFTDTNIPYIIPANSLKKNYPKYDTYISPYHKIKLPNGDFERIINIKLPFIKQFKSNNNTLQLNNKVLDKIVYYNFILDNQQNFIANNLIVESLDENNRLLNN